MRQARRPVVLVIAAVIAGLAASVVSPTVALCDDESEGRRHFKNGTDLYRKNRFLEAAEEFEAGYRAAPRPLFLLNIGHSYRRGGELKKAREAYKRLLEVEPDLPQRAEIEGYLRTIDDALAVSEIPLAPPPRNGSSASPPASPPRVPALQPQPSSGRDEAPAPVFVERTRAAPSEPEDSGSVASRPWFWVATVGLVIAGGVAAALLLKSDDPCPADACFKEP